MIKFLGIFFSLVFVFSCGKEEENVDYSRYFLMDDIKTEAMPFRPKRKATVPFTYNQLYDPYIKKKKGINKKGSKLVFIK